MDENSLLEEEIEEKDIESAIYDIVFFVDTVFNGDPWTKDDVSPKEILYLEENYPERTSPPETHQRVLNNLIKMNPKWKEIASDEKRYYINERYKSFESQPNKKERIIFYCFGHIDSPTIL